MTEKQTVLNAAKALDRVIPGWYKRIDLNRLNMADSNLCILGQLFGHNIELALAREMYPDMEVLHCGYTTGRFFVDSWAGLDAAKLEEANALKLACAGGPNECDWAEEVADRLVEPV